MFETGEERLQVSVEPTIETAIQRRILLEPEPMPPVRPNDAEMKIILGIPMERTILQKAFFSFIEIFVAGWPVARLEYTRNDIARHKFAEFMMGTDYTHLLMLDSDHVHPPDIVQRLARWFRAYPEQVRVAGGLNFRRGEPYDPCAFVDPGDGHYRRMSEWGRGAIEVEALGTGSVMIARNVFEELPQPWFAYDYSHLQGWPGTDMWFSKLCTDHKIALWCDTTTSSPHLGDMYITEESYRAWLKEHGVPGNQG